LEEKDLEIPIKWEAGENSGSPYPTTTGNTYISQQTI
jgi:hypothetical protein